MHKIILILFVLLITGCEEKDKPHLPRTTAHAPLTAENEIRLLKEVLRDDPDNLQAWINLGNIFMDTRRFQEAIEAYQKALKIDPNNVDVRVDMGTCYRYSGRPDKAVEHYRKAISINPKHINAHRNLAIVLAYDFGDRLGAAKEFETYLELAPTAPDAPEIRKEIQRLRATR
jgi:tetratricopeptide (TPR) repeat protein